MSPNFRVHCRIVRSWLLEARLPVTLILNAHHNSAVEATLAVDKKDNAALQPPDTSVVQAFLCSSGETR